jgi:predicted transcriptional regulator
MTLHLEREDDRKKILEIAKGLSSPIRLDILKELYKQPKSIPELSKILDIPASSLEFHIQQMEKSGLIIIKFAPDKKGYVRVCYGNYGSLNILLYTPQTSGKNTTYCTSAGVGMYTDLFCAGERGIATENAAFRNEESDFNESRNVAGLLWLSSGWINYAFSNGFAKNAKVSSISFSLEICSETNGYRTDWKSDITFSINGLELFAWTSPGDMGDKAGLLNPSWWPRGNTQYGFLKNITVNEEGCFLDGKIMNKNVNINMLSLEKNSHIDFTISNKTNSLHIGGFNIFGKTFGNFKQDIILSAICDKQQF